MNISLVIKCALICGSLLKSLIAEVCCHAEYVERFALFLNNKLLGTKRHLKENAVRMYT